MQTNLNFKLMAMEFWLRDRFHPPVALLTRVGIKPGMNVLDFGCGPGGFALAAAELAGPAGQVFAVDIHPLALRKIERARIQRNLPNLHAIHGSKLNELENKSVDLILLYDVLHDLEEPVQVIKQFHRLLKPGGNVSIKDHKLSNPEINEHMTREGLFRPAEQVGETLHFAPVWAGENATQ